MNIGFVIDEWETLNPQKDSTLRMIHETYTRGHKAILLYPHNLTIRTNVTCAFVKVIKVKEELKKVTSVSKFYKSVEFEEKLVPLSVLDALFLRKDPPTDTKMLNFLDSIAEEVFIVNSIEGIRKASNKLYTATFHDPNHEFIPKTYVSKNVDYLKRVIEESTDDKMILKPLDGFGGSGVIVLEKSARKNLNSLLDFYINNKTGRNYIIVQEYVPEAEFGDVRALMLNGNPIGAYKRIPSDEDNRSNIHAGGTAEKYSLNKEERKWLKKLGKKLVHDGIYFAGLDIIGGKLIEVNVQSPGGITNINRLNRTKLQKKIIDFVEEKIEEKTDLFNQKEYRINTRKHYRTEVFDA